MSDYKTLTTGINIYRKGDNPIFGESVTSIRLEDESGGMFLIITQDTDDRGQQELRLELDELELLYKTAKELFKGYKE